MVFGDILGGAGTAMGGLASLLGLTGEGGEAQLQEIARLWQSINRPEFDMRELSAPELQAVSEYFPEFYQAHVPDSAVTISDSPEVRASLGQNLGYFENVRNEGLPLAEQIAARTAQNRVAKAHRDTTASSMEELRRRGRSGGGAEAALRLGANQQSAELARGMADDLSLGAINNRYRAAQDVAAAGGSLRGQDINLGSQNANILNNYHAMVSQMLTNQARDNAQSAQDAQWANAAESQRVADTNEMAGYQNALENLTRRNALGQQDFQNQATQAAGQSGALQSLANAQYAQQSANRDNIMSVAQGGGQALGGALDMAFPEDPKKRRGGVTLNFGGY